MGTRVVSTEPLPALSEENLMNADDTNMKKGLEVIVDSTPDTPLLFYR